MKSRSEYQCIAILGMWAEWQSAIRFLHQQGVPQDRIVLLDRNPVIDYPWYRQQTGKDYVNDLSDYDLIVKSPGISPYDNPLVDYRDRIVTTTQLFFDHYVGHTIAISGTKGKSTLTTVMYQTLSHAGLDCHIAGNIGIPLLDLLTQQINRPDHRLVVELSSYMLDHLEFKPDIGILVNIYPDHLDRHHGLQPYIDAKFRLVDQAQTVILSGQVCQTYPDRVQHLQYISFGDRQESDYYFAHPARHHGSVKLGDARQYRLHGDYIYANMGSIRAVCDCLSIDPHHLHEVLLKFDGLPHRMQYLGLIHGIHRYDDAISTTPESTLVACQHLGDRLHTILLWGSDRWYDFSVLVDRIAQSQIGTIILFPDTGAHISLLLTQIDRHYQILYTDNMEQAVQFAYNHTPADHICLLSTASPSYRCWANFEEKGDRFQQAIAML